MTLLSLPRPLGALALAPLSIALACAPEPPMMSEGQALFLTHCMACHGEGAQGDGPIASTLPVQPANLLEHLSHHTRTQLNQLIRTGIPPAMPPIALGEAEVQLIIDHVWTLVPESEVAALRAMQQEVESGAMPGMAATTATPPAGAQEFSFAGSVRSVDAQARTLSVLNDDIPGWMGAMTMSYSVDSPSALQGIEVGDRITARVYAGDFRTLYGVEVVRD